ncbi:MAG: LemA family protein [Bacteroidaceae bacterium]|jgi:LemA protein|nr:LemA family protein [Bacteroidaceae bacterium]
MISTTLIVILVLAFIVILIVGYIIATQRKLVSLDEFCKNAMSQISVQLNSRWDAVQNLAKLAAQYAKHESETITNVIQQRRMGQVTTAQQANEQQDAISSVMGRLIAIGEAYPELKADGLFRETMDGVRAYEEKVRMSRMVYNDTATKYNRLIRQFPSSIVASMLNYNTQKDYLQVDDQKKTNYPDLDDVFKK